MTLGGHRTPAELLAIYDAGCKGLDDIDMHEILHDIIADIQDSYTKAMQAQGFSAITVKAVTDTVCDYIANNYGDN